MGLGASAQSRSTARVITTGTVRRSLELALPCRNGGEPSRARGPSSRSPTTAPKPPPQWRRALSGSRTNSVAANSARVLRAAMEASPLGLADRTLAEAEHWAHAAAMEASPLGLADPVPIPAKGRQGLWPQWRRALSGSRTSRSTEFRRGCGGRRNGGEPSRARGLRDRFGHRDEPVGAAMEASPLGLADLPRERRRCWRSCRRNGGEPSRARGLDLATSEALANALPQWRRALSGSRT
jgi:hypothetical protein